MLRTAVALALAGTLVEPVRARAGHVYSYVDQDGVIRVFDETSDEYARLHKRAPRARGRIVSTPQVHRIEINERIPPDQAQYRWNRSGKDYDPHVQTAVKGQNMVVRNDDPMLHNTHMYLDKKTIFNAALPRQGMEIKKPIQKAEAAAHQAARAATTSPRERRYRSVIFQGSMIAISSAFAFLTLLAKTTPFFPIDPPNWGRLGHGDCLSVKRPGDSRARDRACVRTFGVSA